MVRKIKSRRSTRNTDRATFTQWVENSGITSSAKRLPASNDPQWRGASKWKVTLRKGRKSMSLDYHMGSAHKGEPDTIRVLYSIVSDVSSYEGSRPLKSKDELDHAESFSNDMGYEGMQGLRVFRAIKKEAAQFKRFVGPAEYGRVLSLEMDY